MRQKAPDFLFHPIFDEAEALAGVSNRRLIDGSLALASLNRTCRDHRPDAAALTTVAFDQSGLRWFGISDLIAESRRASFIS
jgi:hypothetical protein